MTERALECLRSWVQMARNGAFGALFTREDCDFTCRKDRAASNVCIVCETEALLKEVGIDVETL